MGEQNQEIGLDSGRNSFLLMIRKEKERERERVREKRGRRST